MRTVKENVKGAKLRGGQEVTGARIRALGIKVTYMSCSIHIYIYLNHISEPTKLKTKSKLQQPNFKMYLSRRQTRWWEGTWALWWREVNNGGRTGIGIVMSETQL